MGWKHRVKARACKAARTCVRRVRAVCRASGAKAPAGPCSPEFRVFRAFYAFRVLQFRDHLLCSFVLSLLSILENINECFYHC